MSTQSDKIRELFGREIEFRTEFRDLKVKLESLVSPITKHNRECCAFWEKNFPDLDEVVISLGENETYKIKRPTLEDCSVETYLPYGIDFTKCVVVNCEPDTE